MANLTKHLGKLFVSAGFAVSSLLAACIPITERKPVMLTPPKTSVYEGNPYSSLVQFSGADDYSFEVTSPAGNQRWTGLEATAQPNGVYIDGSAAPLVSRDTVYPARLLASNIYGTTEVDFGITVLDTDGK